MRYRRVVTRAALALAITAFIPWPHVNGSQAAREFALCMQACNAAYGECYMGCDEACGVDAAPDCKMICRHACLEFVRNCKVTCRPEPESPTSRIVPRS